MVGVVGSSPIAPTKIGREDKHLAETPSAFFLVVPSAPPSAPCAGHRTMRMHLGRALLAFADNPALTTAMGQAARNHIESLYGFSRMQHQLAGIYAAALGR